MIEKVKLKDLDINDPFFDDLKKSYINFTTWFKKKNNRDAYVVRDNAIKALLVLKIENKRDNKIEPLMNNSRKIKISTFKVDMINKGIGSMFIKIIDDFAMDNKIEEIYLTVYDDNELKRSLIRFLEKNGFNYYGLKGKEKVYIKRITI